MDTKTDIEMIKKEEAEKNEQLRKSQEAEKKKDS